MPDWVLNSGLVSATIPSKKASGAGNWAAIACPDRRALAKRVAIDLQTHVAFANAFPSDWGVLSSEAWASHTERMAAKAGPGFEPVPYHDDVAPFVSYSLPLLSQFSPVFKHKLTKFSFNRPRSPSGATG